MALSRRLTVGVFPPLRSGPARQTCALHSRRSPRFEGWRVGSQTGDEPTAETRTLPIFPLNVVALPSCTTNLFIFEARYRVLFSTLLAGDRQLDEELIQEDSPFKGSREFGLCLTAGGTMSKVGTVLRIERHRLHENGEMTVINKGVSRFEVQGIHRMKPILVCEVQMLPDTTDDASPEEIQALSEEVCELYRNVERLTQKVRGTELEAYTEPTDLNDMDPVQLSFWFASLFSESQLEQQQILEERSCQARLLREKKILNEAVKYLSAASALKGAFQSDV